jgi:hypothetical protein
MDKVNFISQMVRLLLEILKMIKFMEQENLNKQIIKSSLDTGNTEYIKLLHINLN